MWLQETLYPDIKLEIKGKLLYKKKTPYQNCRIYQTKQFKRLLLLDDAIQTTEADEHIYHEMLVHPGLLSLPRPKKVLVIGGGDGGVLREVLKHPVDEVIMVEIDKDVIELSKKYLPSLSKGAFSDKRLGLIIDDGAKYISETSKKFDAVIIDSPDPVGPAKVLFSSKFYQAADRVLNANGLLVRQTGSTFLQFNELKNNYRRVNKIFPHVAIQLAAVPTYIGGFFSFMVGSKKINFLNFPNSKIKRRYQELKLKTKYYNPGIHAASLQLPNTIKEVIK